LQSIIKPYNQDERRQLQNGAGLSTAKMVPADSIRRALNIIGEQWTVLILRELFIGLQRYSELHAALGVAHATLSRRLGQLVEHGIIEKQASQRYKLTNKGKDLLGFILAMRHWQLQWHEAPQLVRPLLHTSCNTEAHYPLVCTHCKQELKLEDIERRDGPGAGLEEAPPQRHLRRGKSGTVDEGAFQVPAICRDQRAAQVLNACYQGKLRFQELQDHLQLPPQIISSRLSLLCEIDFLRAAENRRGGYALTDRALGFYPVLQALATWGASYLSTDEGPPERYIHKTCGKHLQIEPQCTHCRTAIHYGDLRSL
jgi:DNA-binding HxlR family transcriptional regulator